MEGENPRSTKEEVELTGSVEAYVVVQFCDLDPHSYLRKTLIRSPILPVDAEIGGNTFPLGRFDSKCATVAKIQQMTVW